VRIPLNSSFITELITGNRQWIIGHAFTFTSVDGANDYFTDMDLDIVVGGTLFKSGGLRVQGIRTKLAVGVNVDEQEVVIWASPTDTLFGAAALTGLAEGLMDGGMITCQRVVWEDQTGNLWSNTHLPPRVVWTVFTGYMSTIERLGRASVSFKVKSPLVKLNTDMPHNFYQPGCLWSLFDTGCTLNRANFAFSGAVSSGSPTVIQVTGGVSPAVGADSLLYYQRGRLIFTSGVNNGLEVTVDSNDSTAFYLAYPLSAVPAPGDTFTAYPGCSKTFNTCQLKFANTGNFRGCDKVPPVFVAV